MKSLFLRSGAVLACALTLAACGGSGGNLVLSGTVIGLTRDGLVLQNNGANDLTVAANSTSFVFPTLIANDAAFNVTIKSSPPSAVCTALNNVGKTGNFDVNTVIIQCITNTYNLGGTISGLRSSGLVLINGPDRVEVKADANNNFPTTFTMAKVPDGSPYGVTVLTQPANQTCTINGGTGTMGSADINTLQVVCN